MSKPDQSQLNFTPSSQTNAGTAGGTMNYINLGGLKILWGITGSLTSQNGSNYTITFPSSFFTAAPTLAIAAVESMNATAAQMVGVNASASLSTTGATLTTGNVAGSTFTGQQFSYLFIGT